LRRLLTEVEAGNVRDLKPEALERLAAQVSEAAQSASAERTMKRPN